MPLAYTDTETRSTVNIKDGTDRYMTGAECTLVQMAIDNGPVRLWEVMYEPEPVWFTHYARSPHTTFIANSYAFDRAVFERLLKIPTRIEQWLCTRAQGNAHGLSGSLEGLGAQLGLSDGDQKLKVGKDLIYFFCVPQKDGTFRDPRNHPYEWETFKEYACRDIDTMRAAHRRLPSHNFSGVNRQYFWLDGRINERGFAIDVPLAEAAVRVLDAAKARGDTEVAEATGGSVTAITQRKKLLEYLQQKRPHLVNLKKAAIETELQCDDLSPEDRWLLEQRLEGARASGSKYKRALKLHVGARLRYTQQYSGAGATGRTAHKGFQPGNLPRAVTFNRVAQVLAEQHVPMKAKYIDEVVLPAIRSGAILQDWAALAICSPYTACANALRHITVAEPGNVLLDADYKNIESRVLAWLANERWKLTMYFAMDRGEAVDSYKLLYSRFFNIPIEQVNDHMRQAGKVIELACGFGGGVGAFVTMAATYGIDLTTLPALVLPTASELARGKAEKAWNRAFKTGETYGLEASVYQACHVLVQMYRAANPAIDQLKKDLGRAVEHALSNRGASPVLVGRCKVWATLGMLIIELPSGRRLCYWKAAIETVNEVDEETGEEVTKEIVVYYRTRGPRFTRQKAWPGLFVENVVQAVANDFLRYGKIQIQAETYETLAKPVGWLTIIVLAVHDSIKCEVRKGTLTLKSMIEWMCRLPPWAAGMPLSADGWENERDGKR